jgi:uncharacterized spore protein YtfJ
MGEQFEDIVVTTAKTQEQGNELMEKLIGVAQPGAVYSQPITSGDYTIITASEVSVGMGFGYGMSGGTASEAAESPHESGEEASGFGGGGGGGGFSAGRPVAVISVGPRGVYVEPVRDVTKVLVALLTVAGSMLMMLGRMRRMSRG